MGMFDTVHTGSRCGQTKSLGSTLRDIVPGDKVTVCSYSGEVSPDVPSFLVAMVEGGFLLVRENVLVDWVEDLVPSLPVFTNRGELTLITPNPGPSADEVESSMRRAAEQEEKLTALFGVDPGRLQEAREGARRDQLGLPNDCPTCDTLKVSASVSS